MATLFTAATDFTNGGYKTIYKKYSWLPFAINIGTPEAPQYQPPPKLPYQADVRGILPAGTVPSKSLSYRAYWKVVARNTLSNTSPNFIATAALAGGLAGIVIAATPTPGVNIGVSYPSVGVVIFEGKDVVDLPTDDLPTEAYSRPVSNDQEAPNASEQTDSRDEAPPEGGEPAQSTSSNAYFIEVPDRVYLAVHAGAEKLIPENDSQGFPYWANVAANGPLAGNLTKGFVQITEDATFDTVIAAGSSGVGRDVASRKILITGGDAKFVSYIAATKLLYKDVIRTRVSAFTFGYYFGTSALSITETAPSNIEIQSILRFSFLPRDPQDQALEEESEENEETIPQDGSVWRLTESIGIEVQNKVNSLNAEDLETVSARDRGRYGAAQILKHYVYNIKEAGPDFDEDQNILKVAYNPIMANLKEDPTSQLFDSTFKSNQLPYKSVSPQGSIDYQAVDVFGSNPGAQFLVGDPAPELYYTSPMFEAPFTQKTRIGFEHYGQLLNAFGSGALDFRLLVKSKDVVSGLSCCYDPCLTQSSLFSSSTSGILERMFDDRRWTRYQIDTPTGAALPMLTGEFPFRSEGQCVLLPQEKEIPSEIATSFGVPGGQINIQDSEAIVTSVAFRVGAIETRGLEIEDFNDTFRFFTTDKPDADTLPSQEISLGGMALKKGEAVFSIFPTKPKAFRAGGGLREIIKIYGVKNSDVIAEGYAKGSTDGIALQQSAVGPLEFPTTVSNVSSSLDCVSGLYFIAFENENRIDLGVRQSPFEKFSLIRDVVRRVPDDVGGDGTASVSESTNFPPVTLPWLLIDGDVKNIYLFFHYKNRLFCKKIPYEIYIASKKSDPEKRYDVTVEQDISRSIMKITSCMVIDPALFKARTESSFSDLKVDFEERSIKALVKIEDEDSVEFATGELEEDASIQQYCVGMDGSGYMYAFVQVGTRIVVARSSTLAEEWENIIGTKSILPTMPEGMDATQETISSPFVMYDQANDKFMLFFIYSFEGINHSLIYMELSATFLRDTPVNIDALRDDTFKPYLIWGYYDENLQKRGILKSKSEEVNRAVLGSSRFFTDTEAELKLLDNIPIQRIAGHISYEGYYRIFFRDDNNNIRSMVSSDNGKTWLVDEVRPGVDLVISEGGSLDLQTVVDGSNTEFFEELDDFEFLEDEAYEEDDSEDFT